MNKDTFARKTFKKLRDIRGPNHKIYQLKDSKIKEIFEETFGLIKDDIKYLHIMDIDVKPSVAEIEPDLPMFLQVTYTFTLQGNLNYVFYRNLEISIRQDVERVVDNSAIQHN